MFNTVVLFDVENLLGAPPGWAQAASELSFADIIAQLRRDQSGLIDGFAVSRAYANWGREFMGTLRREMTENGVEPRQIFPFDGLGRKNAADIELVIDALELAYTRPGLSTFVIVTRDGGFSSLGRKLHELGKAVIICADSQCSKALRAVSDAFVELPDAGQLVVDRPVVADGDRELENARKAAIREIKALASREGARFKTEGSLLATVGQIFADAAPRLAYGRSGYPGLREFLQWALADTPYCVFGDGSHFRVGLRTSRAADDALPPLDRRPPRVTEGAELYRLLASQGSPVLRLPSPDAAAQVLRAISKSGIRDKDLNTLTIEIADVLAGKVSTAEVKFTVQALAHSDAMLDEPSTVPMSERRYTLVKESRAFPKLRAALLARVREKLASRGEVDEAVLQQLIAG